MSGRRWSFWLIGVLGIAIGAVCGVLIGASHVAKRIRPGYETLASLPWANAVNNASQDVRVLDRLRTGNATEATELLEEQLNENLVVLSSYETDVPAHLKSEAAYHVLQRAAAYRDKYPRPPTRGSNGPQVDAAVAKALAIGRNHVPAP